MRFKILCASLTIASAVLQAVPLRAQSLADVAKKEEERRKELPAPGKVYTNKDLGGGGGTLSVTGQPPAPDSSPDASADKDKSDKSKDAQAKDGKAADKDKGQDKADNAKDQKYWADRHQALTDQIDRDSTYAGALQSQINALTADFVNRDDPVQRAQIERDRQKALSELDKLKQKIEDGKKALADLEEEARRAGVPAGWIR